ncbi:unnamed protein product, partial [Meganyctiphanes norvegica]
IPMIVSVFTLATISIDRMLGVVKPFHRYLKARQAIIIVIIIWTFSSCISTPLGAYMDYTTKIWKDTTEHNCGEKDKLLKSWKAIVYVSLTWIPLLIMLISYITIFINFQHYTKHFHKREHPAIIHVKKRVFQMMFIVVALFNICWMPFLVFQVCCFPDLLFVGENGQVVEKYTQVYKAFNSVSHYMMYISPAINPYLYALLHRNYRRALRVTFPCIFKNKYGLKLTPRDGGRGYAWSRSKSHTPAHSNTLPKDQHEYQNTPIRRVNSTGSVATKRGKADIQICINGGPVTASFQTMANLKKDIL